MKLRSIVFALFAVATISFYAAGLAMGQLVMVGSGEENVSLQKMSDSAYPPDAGILRQLILNAEPVQTETAQVEAGRTWAIETSKRSIPLATGLSAILPGGGQAYNKQWIKASAMLLTEAALVSGYAVWKTKGLDGEDAFRAVAHSDWSPEKYAMWLNDYSTFLEDNHGAVVTAPDVILPDGIDFSNPDAWSGSTAIEVTTFFDQIRNLESQMFHPETGASFSHRLPYFAEQQYYELIGKYYQFAPGWGDYAAWVDANGYTTAIDPERSDSDGEKLNVTDSFFNYASDHAESQTFLRRASRLSAILFVNHILSAADAAIFAKLHNNRISTSLALVADVDGFVVPSARIKISM